MAPEFGSASVGGAGSGAGGTGAVAEAAVAESGYGIEPGYRDDVELGYGDEIDEEEEDGRQQLFFWGEEIGDLLVLNSGKVVAVGPGERDRDGKLIPVALKEGDTVLLPEYGGLEVKLAADKEYLLFGERDILGTLVD